MNFNIGDRVVNYHNLTHWDNHYHHKMAVQAMHNVKTVHSVNENRFCTLPNVELPAHGGGLGDREADGHVFYQKDGRLDDGSYGYSMVNLTTNKAGLIAYMTSLYNTAKAEAYAEDAKEIASLQAQIDALQHKILRIEQGQRKWNGTDIVQHDFLDGSYKRVLEAIEKSAQ